MTVEASLLMPMVIFILAGLCYSFFFMHDYIVMQNEGYRRTEAELWHRETEEDMPVFMMSVLLDGFRKEHIAAGGGLGESSVPCAFGSSGRIEDPCTRHTKLDRRCAEDQTGSGCDKGRLYKRQGVGGIKKRTVK